MPGQRSVKLGGTNLDWESGRVGKGAGTKFPDGKDSRAPCPRCHNSQLRKTAWARRTIGSPLWPCGANAFAHPTIPALDGFGKTKPRQEVPASRRSKARASRFLPKRSHRSENIQKLNNIMPIFDPASASLRARKTGSHRASKCSRVAFIPGGSNFLRAGAGLATLDHCC